MEISRIFQLSSACLPSTEYPGCHVPRGGVPKNVHNVRPGNVFELTVTRDGGKERRGEE